MGVVAILVVNRKCRQGVWPIHSGSEVVVGSELVVGLVCLFFPGSIGKRNSIQKNGLRLHLLKLTVLNTSSRTYHQTTFKLFASDSQCESHLRCQSQCEKSLKPLECVSHNVKFPFTLSGVSHNVNFTSKLVGCFSWVNTTFKLFSFTTFFS